MKLVVLCPKKMELVVHLDYHAGKAQTEHANWHWQAKRNDTRLPRTTPIDWHDSTERHGEAKDYYVPHDDLCDASGT
jgi:hypothetical protein